MTKFSGISALLLVISLAGSADSADDAVERSVSFGIFSTPQNRLRVPLGVLPADREIDVTVRLVNVTQSIIDLKSLRTSCNCLQAKVPDPLIQPDGEAEIQLKLHTRIRSFKPDQVTTFQLEFSSDEGRTERATLLLEYSLAGIIAFPRRKFHHEFASKAKKVSLSLPLLVTDPIDARSLDIDSNFGVLPEIRKDDEIANKWWIDFQFDTESLNRDLALTDVIVSDPKTGRKTEASVSLFRTGEFRLLPKTLRFEQSSENGIWRAAAILRVAESPDKERNGGAESGSARLFAEAMLGEKKMTVKADELTENVYRLRVSTSMDLTSSDISKDSVLTWRFLLHDKNAVVTSPFYVDNSAH